MTGCGGHREQRCSKMGRQALLSNMNLMLEGAVRTELWPQLPQKALHIFFFTFVKQALMLALSSIMWPRHGNDWTTGHRSTSSGVSGQLLHSKTHLEEGLMTWPHAAHFKSIWN